MAKWSKRAKPPTQPVDCEEYEVIPADSPCFRVNRAMDLNTLPSMESMHFASERCTVELIRRLRRSNLGPSGGGDLEIA